MRNTSGLARLRAFLVGHPLRLGDRSLFHRITLGAILAWIGVGADGLSSSCYGPEETFKALGAYAALSPIIALMCVATITIICISYRQIIELFPGGGGGYLVASRLLSPTAGVVSGSALLIDYILTIAISIASGIDALFSLLPAEYQTWKLATACLGIGILALLNLRGVKESVTLFMPIFFAFIITHAIAILVVIGFHLFDFGMVIERTHSELRQAHEQLGLWGLVALLLRAFSVGAGTYTGIEAVSNSMPVLREPKVETGKKTMTLMGFSLGITVFGLLLAYLLERVEPVSGKTLNAVLFESMTRHWPESLARTFVWVSLLSATALLFIAAQAGFLDGPRVVATMAMDRWFPTRFASLSDRFVTQNGILLMGLAATLTVLLTEGSVSLLVVLYSINVFLTFTLSQLGMVCHWFNQRTADPAWKRKLIINGTGLIVTGFILITIFVEKFEQGGWVTILITASVVAIAFLIKSHYQSAFHSLKRLEALVTQTERHLQRDVKQDAMITRSGSSRTAIVLVNGFNGLGLHTFYGVSRVFPGTFGKFIFVQVGVVDAGSFKGAEQLEHLRQQTSESVQKYVDLARHLGFEATGEWDLSHDPLSTLQEMTQHLIRQHPTAVVFGGQLAFARETIWTRWLHNYAVFALQRFFCREAIPFVIIPAKV